MTIRLLMTTDAVGGVWTYALDLARGLAVAGVETTLVVLGPSATPSQVADAHAVSGLTLIDTGLPLDWMAAEPAEVLEVSAALRGLARTGFDLVHLNNPAFAALGGFPAPVVGVSHSCLATWWSAVRDGPMPPEFRWRTQLLWQGLHHCHALVAPTRAFAEATARTYELPRPAVVWNGRRPAAALRKDEYGPCVFTSGRLWDEGKGVRVLDQAAARIRAPVYAAGPLHGPNGSGIELRHARPVGRLTTQEVGKWLERAPVYASAARYEPFGLGVLEAAQAGCALVLSDIPTFRELWEGAAVFVSPDDPGGLADAANRLLAQEGERRALAAKARARAARYTVDSMAAGMLDVYGRLLRRPVGLLPKEAAA
jgi:glycogen synthase